MGNSSFLQHRDPPIKESSPKASVRSIAGCTTAEQSWRQSRSHSPKQEFVFMDSQRDGKSSAGLSKEVLACVLQEARTWQQIVCYWAGKSRARSWKAALLGLGAACLREEEGELCAPSPGSLPTLRGRFAE
ncbi:hypothetical protein AV530_008252 [Patagioenas fasciata monilis]|uniref:Uncharacterized protein n=1 Tax=Patagioenas fasciata monilis TaxID=372326 RepID=A0A1V4KV37_PATFA|nr:hypothetical protein AV530_008252 [Patagioenas fasciata monilis]